MCESCIYFTYTTLGEIRALVHWLVQLDGYETTVLHVKSKILGGLAMPNYTDLTEC